MKKFAVFNFLISICFYPVLGDAQDAMKEKISLSECITIALKNNLDVQKSVIQTETAELNKVQRMRDLLPVVNATVVHGINQGRSIDPFTNAYINQQITYANQDLSGSLLLFNGLAMQNLISQSSFAFQASKEQEQQAKDNLALNVILIYLQVLTNEDLLKLSAKQQEITLKQVERLEVLNTQGAINPASYYDLKGQLSNDQLAFVNTKNTLENSKLTLAQLLNIPYDKNLQLEQLSAEESSFMYEVNPEQLYQVAEQNLAMVKAADLMEKSAYMQIKYARSAYSPSVYLRGGVISNFSSAAYDPENRPIGYADQFYNNLGKSVNLTVNIPIFNAFRTKSAVSLAKLRYKETELVAQTTRMQLQQLTQQAYFNMVAAKERYDILKDQVDAFSESFRTADVRFNSGVITSVDYMVSKNNLDKAKTYLITARYDFILRKKIVDFYQGKLF
jgi:outer membrane protein